MEKKPEEIEKSDDLTEKQKALKDLFKAYMQTTLDTKYEDIQCEEGTLNQEQLNALNYLKEKRKESDENLGVTVITELEKIECLKGTKYCFENLPEGRGFSILKKMGELMRKKE